MQTAVVAISSIEFTTMANVRATIHGLLCMCKATLRHLNGVADDYVHTGDDNDDAESQGQCRVLG